MDVEPLDHIGDYLDNPKGWAREAARYRHLIQRTLMAAALAEHPLTGPLKAVPAVTRYAELAIHAELQLWHDNAEAVRACLAGVDSLDGLRASHGPASQVFRHALLDIKDALIFMPDVLREHLRSCPVYEAFETALTPIGMDVPGIHRHTEIRTPPHPANDNEPGR